jgi:ParB-like nuclease family protein
MTEFAIKDILPNPFRHIDRYPIKREKVDALRESLRATGFWGNVVARLGPTPGTAEIAYGHHRRAALLEEYGPDYKVSLIIQDLSDEQMLKHMARENMEEWSTDSAVEQETIRSVVEALAAGKISFKVPAKTPKSEFRYAPSFRKGHVPLGRAEHRYTAQAIAEFVGWLQPKNGAAQRKTHTTLTALELIEDDILEDDAFEGLSSKEAEALVNETRKARDRRETSARIHKATADNAAKVAITTNDAEERSMALRRQAFFEEKAQEEHKLAFSDARNVSTEVSEQLKDGKGYARAPDIAHAVVFREDKPIPDIERFTYVLVKDIGSILDGKDSRTTKLNELVKFRGDLKPHSRKDICDTLRMVITRFTEYRDALLAEQPESLVTTPKLMIGLSEVAEG